ncbi:glycosyltransferase [Macrococcus bovicus]|uniref:Glycosyltransferase n=1 Tax=Macrococcus bovicus TaxID=69968 RepID=A0A4R6C154_9STAP|nr:glycosyltransferase [Macrococcus bovicus]TDM14917.1 glycosyltransferase [Macrococcus bovicus]
MKATFIHDFPVIISNENYYSLGGFPENIWDRYLKYFDELNIICRISSDKFDINKCVKSNTHKVNFYPQLNYSSLRNLSKRRASIRNMNTIIKESDFVIIRLPSILGVDAFKFIKKYNKPYLVEVVGNGYDAFNLTNKISGKILAPFIHYMMKKIVYNANGAIYVTEKYLQNIYSTKGINDNVSNVNIDWQETRNFNFEKKINVNNVIKIGFMGKPDLSYKNFYRGIDYLGRFSKEKGYNFEVSIAGGEINNSLKELFNKYSRLELNSVGKLSNKKLVNEWFKTLDIFIHPSLTEGLPRVILEAFSNNKPVIASNVGGTPELLSEDFMFNPLSYDEFKVALMKLLDSDLNKVLNENNIKLKNYDSAFLQQKRDRVFKEVLYKERLI